MDLFVAIVVALLRSFVLQHAMLILAEKLNYYMHRAHNEKRSNEYRCVRERKNGGERESEQKEKCAFKKDISNCIYFHVVALLLNN